GMRRFFCLVLELFFDRGQLRNLNIGKSSGVRSQESGVRSQESGVRSQGAEASRRGAVDAEREKIVAAMRSPRTLRLCVRLPRLSAAKIGTSRSSAVNAAGKKGGA